MRIRWTIPTSRLICLGGAVIVLATLARASQTSCPPPPEGAAGCGCVGVACGSEPDTESPCYATGTYCFQDQCWNRVISDEGFYVVSTYTNPTSCGSDGPLEGNGCNAGLQAAICKERRACLCDWNGECIEQTDAPLGAFTPCYAL